MTRNLGTRSLGGLSRTANSGFTLIELLIVIAIIALLIALSMAAVMRTRVNAQVRSSTATVEKLQVGVDAQYKAIIAQAQIDIKQGGSTQDARAMLDLMNQDPEAALALLTYCRVRQSFPQVFSEVAPFNVCNAYTYPVKTQFASFAGASSGTLNVSQQSAALLYAAVSGTGAGGQSFASDETLQGNQLDFVLAGAPTIHVYMDAWQQPIGFCRFGTNTELQSPPYASTTNIMPNYNITLKDPFDPAGKLWLFANHVNPTMMNQAAAVLFLNNGDAANATGFTATNRRLVVYSTGPNQAYESLNQTANTNPLGASGTLDDILGYQNSQLGKSGLQ